MGRKYRAGNFFSFFVLFLFLLGSPSFIALYLTVLYGEYMCFIGKTPIEGGLSFVEKVQQIFVFNLNGVSTKGIVLCVGHWK